MDEVKRYKVANGNSIELLRGFMDDVSILTSSVAMAKIALRRTEVVVAWARMKLKPVKSRSFLDLEITINNNQFEYKLFDKRRAFPFHIIRFPFQCSNIPKKMFFSTIQAEILRICRVSTHYHPFIDACNPFLSRMSKQGASKVDLKINISKLLLRHSGEFSKYQFPNREIVNSLVINVA